MVERLGWTLVHFVWEGAAVALLLGLCLLATRRAVAGVRYGLACAAMALLAVLPFATFASLTSPVRPVAATGASTITPGETILASGTAVRLLPILVAAWAAGVVLLCARLVGTLVHLERWKRRHARLAGPEWQARVDALAKRLGVRRPVEALLSDRIEVPSAWGVLRSVVVLPTSLIAGISPEGVEAVLLHELAHIRRHDYLVNLLQTVVETVLFYHPAVWWVSATARREREHCCDDAVVACLSDPMPYARALLHLEERRLALPQPTLSAKGSKLMNRIARILGAKPAPVRLSPLASTLAALGIVGAVLGGAYEAQAQTKPAPKPVASLVASVKPARTEAVRRALVAQSEADRAVSQARRAYLAATLARQQARVAQERRALSVALAQASLARADMMRQAQAVRSKAARADAVGSIKVAEAKAPPYPRPQAAIAAPAQKVSGEKTATAMPAPVNPAGGFGGGVAFAPAPGSFGGGGFGGGGVAAAAPASGGLGGGGFGRSGPEEIFVVAKDDTVTVDAKDATLASVLRRLAIEAHLSIVIESGAYRDVTVVLSNRLPEEAFAILCRAGNATVREEGSIWYVSPR